MKSPITGKEMNLLKEPRSISFRKEDYEVTYHYLLCSDSGEQFTSTELDEINMSQLYNQYRVRHKLPFPDEIKTIRERYGLPAIKMAEVLGFGVNVYRNYENGEVPNESNARLIQLAQDPKKFKSLVELSAVYEDDAKEKLLNKINVFIEEDSKDVFKNNFVDYLLGSKLPDEFSGYRKPSLEKLTEMVVYFTEELQPWKTKLNKLLFYADFVNFRNTCYSISGARYSAIDMGPVPDNFNSIFDFIAKEDHVDIVRTEFENGGMGEQFKPNAKKRFNSELFDENELHSMDFVVKKFGKTSTREIIDISHKEKTWIENYELGKRKISYSKYGFDLQTI